MAPNTQQPDLQQEVLQKLNHALDLVLKTAETASAQNNHKVVIQAAREVTRIATLITKMTAAGTKAKLGQSSLSPAGKTVAPAASHNKKISQRALDYILPDLGTLFPPERVAPWDGVSQEIFKDITKNYQELQAIGADMAQQLEKPANGNGKAGGKIAGK